MSFLSTLGDIASFVASPIASSVNSIIGNKTNKQINASNQKFAREQADIAYQRQRDLLVDTPSLQLQGLRAAGISASSLNGAPTSVPTVSQGSTPSSQGYVPFDFSSLQSLAPMIAGLENTAANTRKLNADAKSQELDNRAKEAEQNAWMRATDKGGYFLDDNGTKHYTTDKDFDSWAKSYMSDHKGALPELVKLPNIYSESAARIDNVIASLHNDIERYGAETAQNKLAAAVANSKLHDKAVMHALYKMDVAQYDTLLKSIDKANSEIDLNKFQKDFVAAQTDKARQEIAESIARTVLLKTQDKALQNSSVANLIDSLDSSKSFSENLVTIGKIILGLIQGTNILK